MPDDLNISESEEQEAALEFDSPHDDIAAAYNALSAISDIDTAILSKVDVTRIKAIKRMSLKIIHEQIKWIHDSIFFEEPDEEE